MFIDLSDKVANRLPLFIAAVVGLSFLLLMAVFRSVLVPLKAALMNLLSIGAAYGVVTAVFQDGVGASLIGADSGVPVVSFIPVMMFAILFGLSMDYNVFLLSRVHEAYNEGDRPRESVIHGMARIGKVILFAGMIMSAVFLAFVTQPDIIGKMFGLGLGLALGQERRGEAGVEDAARLTGGPVGVVEHAEMRDRGQARRHQRQTGRRRGQEAEDSGRHAPRRLRGEVSLP